jgi:hypothetical protein
MKRDNRRKDSLPIEQIVEKNQGIIDAMKKLSNMLDREVIVSDDKKIQKNNNSQIGADIDN